MNADPIDLDLDAFDQSGKKGTLPCCGQLGPDPADFLSSRDQPAAWTIAAFKDRPQRIRASIH
jgi:hypothetical protein